MQTLVQFWMTSSAMSSSSTTACGVVSLLQGAQSFQ